MEAQERSDEAQRADDEREEVRELTARGSQGGGSRAGGAAREDWRRVFDPAAQQGRRELDPAVVR